MTHYISCVRITALLLLWGLLAAVCQAQGLPDPGGPFPTLPTPSPTGPTTNQPTVTVTDSNDPAGLAAAHLPTMPYRWGSYTDEFSATLSGLPPADTECIWQIQNWFWAVIDNKFMFTPDDQQTWLDPDQSLFSSVTLVTDPSNISITNLFASGVNQFTVDAAVNLTETNTHTGAVVGYSGYSGQDTSYVFAIAPYAVIMTGPNAKSGGIIEPDNTPNGITCAGFKDHYPLNIVDNENPYHLYTHAIITESFPSGRDTKENLRHGVGDTWYLKFGTLQVPQNANPSWPDIDLYFSRRNEACHYDARNVANWSLSGCATSFSETEV